jgi:prepilin-type processing-associated H-X9-DG protein
LAIWHYNKSNLGFADGHAETHRWMDKRTIRLGQVKTQNELDSAIKVDQTGNQDLIYMQKHYAALRGAETD